MNREPASTKAIRRSAATNIVALRWIELAGFLAVVAVARVLGAFAGRVGPIAAVVGAGALAQWALVRALASAGARRAWNDDRTDEVVRRLSTALDILVAVTVVWLSGAVESPFLFLVAVPVFFAGHILPWRETVRGVLPGAVALVAAVAAAELHGVLPHVRAFPVDPEMYRDPRFVAGTLGALGMFTALVLVLSRAFRDRVGSVVERLERSRDESRERVHELSRLYDISLGINSAISVETLLRIVAKEVTLLVDRPWAAIVLFNEKQEVTHSVFVGVNQNREVRLDRRIRRGGLSEWIWAHNAPIVVENIEKDRRANCSVFLQRFGIRSIVGYPIASGRRVTGAIYTGDFECRGMSPRRLELLGTLAAQLAAAIEKSSLHESLERRIRDLERQLAAVEKMNVLKSEYVSHVSHELKTPLTAIKAYVETLVAHHGDPNFSQAPEFLDIVSRETDRLIRIVGDILDVSRIEFGQRPLHRQAVRVSELVDEVVRMLAPTFDERDVAIRVDIPASLPRMDADPDLMKQVLVNLLNNAVKYSPAGTTVTVRAEEAPVDVRITVEDEGIGIPADQLDSVFEKFFRVRDRRGMEGVGLGLAIVRNIVEQHGGTITVESEEGRGTRFTFTVPREHCFNDLIGYIAEVVDAREQLHEMLELIVRMIAELLQARIVSLMLLDRTRSELFIKMSYGLDEWVVRNTRVKLGEGIAGRVAESGVPLFIDNIEENDVYSCPNNPQYDTVSLLSVPLVVNDVVVGVINVNNKADGRPFTRDDLNLLMSFSERISRALERVRVVEDSHSYLQDTIEAFRRMIDAKSRLRMIEAAVDLAVKTSRRMGLSEKDVSVIQYVASVHDIGMTEISDEILNKTLNLTEAEREAIQKHPERGAELIRPLEFVEQVSNIILYHHERVDGTGYPMGLRGEQIPVGARVIAVIDAFQAMTMGRPYRARASALEAAEELVRCAGTQFDPDVVDAFLVVLREDGRISLDGERRLRASLRGHAVADPVHPELTS